MDAPATTQGGASEAKRPFVCSAWLGSVGLERRAGSGESRGLVGVGGLLDTVQLGDNTEVLARLPAECIDLVVTSPPYDDLRTYGGHSWDFARVARELTRVLKPGGVIVWVVADATKDGSETLTSMRQAIHFKDVCGLNVHDTMIYLKENYLPQNAPDRYDHVWEYALVICKGRPQTANLLRDRKNAKAGQTLLSGGRKNADGVLHDKRVITCAENGLRSNVWRVPVGGEYSAHPAAMPYALARDHVTTWSNPGDVVLDPFAGSGTTLKAAKELNRHWLGIEINPDYVEICRARLAQDVLMLFPTGGGGAEPVREDSDGTAEKLPNSVLNKPGTEK